MSELQIAKDHFECIDCLYQFLNHPLFKIQKILLLVTLFVVNTVIMFSEVIPKLKFIKNFKVQGNYGLSGSFFSRFDLTIDQIQQEDCRIYDDNRGRSLGDSRFFMLDYQMCYITFAIFILQTIIQLFLTICSICRNEEIEKKYKKFITLINLIFNFSSTFFTIQIILVSQFDYEDKCLTNSFENWDNVESRALLAFIYTQLCLIIFAFKLIICCFDRWCKCCCKKKDYFTSYTFAFQIAYLIESALITHSYSSIFTIQIPLYIQQIIISALVLYEIVKNYIDRKEQKKEEKKKKDQQKYQQCNTNNTLPTQNK